MITNPFRFHPNAAGYDVSDRTTGELLGQVFKRSEHYNLRRPVTIHFWTATTPDRRTVKDGGGQVAARFDTRRQAAEALAERKQS